LRITNKEDEKKKLEEAWDLYAKAYRQCQDFFSEYLEVIGGLAFRKKVQEVEVITPIYDLADDLMSTSVPDITPLFRSVHPTLPALPETLLKTMAHIIGLRFPEWTIWTLPSIAHELGHILIHDDRILREFVEKTQGEKWTAKDNTKRSKKHLTEFIADAFSTFVMGPAYACSAIFLKFNPTTADRDSDEHPGDAKRAYLVFTMLRKMNDEDDVLNPYANVVTVLTKIWEDMLERAGQREPLQASDKGCLEELVKKAWGLFAAEALRGDAKYPYNNPDRGWTIAKKWKERWSEQLNNGESLSIEKVGQFNTLRDVLNAAWLCRLEHEDNITKIEEAARALWKQIKEVRTPSKSTQGRKGGTRR